MFDWYCPFRPMFIDHERFRVTQGRPVTHNTRCRTDGGLSLSHQSSPLTGSSVFDRFGVFYPPLPSPFPFRFLQKELHAPFQSSMSCRNNHFIRLNSSGKQHRWKTKTIDIRRFSEQCCTQPNSLEPLRGGGAQTQATCRLLPRQGC